MSNLADIINYLARTTLVDEIAGEDDGESTSLIFDEIIEDFSPAAIASWEAAGAVAIAQYDDDTETQIPWSEVHEIPRSRASPDAVGIATNQHFYWDGTGAHVVTELNFVGADPWSDVLEVTWDEMDANTWEHSCGAELNPQPDAGYNSLWNSLGMLFRKATNLLVAITQSAIEFFDGTGNESTNVVARFGVGGAQIGKDGDIHTSISNGKFGIADGTTDVMSIEPLQHFGQYGGGTITFAPSDNGPTVAGNYEGFLSLFGRRSSDGMGFTSITGGATQVAVGNPTDYSKTSLSGIKAVTIHPYGSSSELMSVDHDGVVEAAAGYAVNSSQGVTQTVTIGGKTLTIEGGIITAVN